MSPSTDSGPTLSSSGSRATELGEFDDRPDDLFALVAGLVAAVVVAPLVTAGAARVVADPALSYVLLLATSTLVTIAGALVVRRRRGLPERLGRSRRRWLLTLVGPGLVAVAALVVLALGRPTTTDTVLAVVAGAGGLVGGGVLGTMAHSRYTKAVTAEAEQYASWRAGWSDRRYGPLKALAGVAIAAGVLAFVAALALGSDLMRLAGQFVIPLAAVVYSVGQPRSYTATAAGLETQLPAVRKLTEWDRFEGYVLADDAVVVHQRAPWRLPIICARDDLDDEGSVVAALDRALPRLPAPRP